MGGERGEGKSGWVRGGEERGGGGGGGCEGVEWLRGVYRGENLTLMLSR